MTTKMTTARWATEYYEDDDDNDNDGTMGDGIL